MLGTLAKIGLLLLGVLLLSGAGVSMAVYGSVDPCTMLAEERARRAQDAAEEALGGDAGPQTSGEAAERARDVIGRAAGEVQEGVTEARTSIEGASSSQCARDLWNTWF